MYRRSKIADVSRFDVAAKSERKFAELKWPAKNEFIATDFSLRHSGDDAANTDANGGASSENDTKDAKKDLDAATAVLPTLLAEETVAAALAATATATATDGGDGGDSLKNLSLEVWHLPVSVFFLSLTYLGGNRFYGGMKAV
jgi:hypothetical protein